MNIKKTFRRLERNILILIAIPLPAFAFAYLYTTSGNLDLQVPELPEAFNMAILGLVSAILLVQYLNFKKGIKTLRQRETGLEAKINGYARLTMMRYWAFFISGFLCALGLIAYKNPGFTIAYAITLVMISLAKPTPDRISKLFKCKGEEKEMVMDINRRED